MKIVLKKRSRWFLLVLSSLCLFAYPTHADDDDDSDEIAGPVIQVAPPSGDAATDVLNIQSAIDMATPGTIVQFDSGTYQVTPGSQFVIFVDDVTLQGDDDARTTIQGLAAFPPDFLFVGDLLLVASRTTIRDLTFEGFDVAIEVYRDGVQPTGHTIEDCTFRNGFLPIQTWSATDDVIHIQNNRMTNVQFAVRVIGNTVHFSDNKVTAPEPETMLAGKPFAVAIIYPQFPLGICENNVFEGNKIVGNADGFIFVSFPGEYSTSNIVRDNEFIDMRVWFDFDIASMVILDANGGIMEGNIIEGNEADGNEGVGILLFGANHNYVVDNEFEDFVVGDVRPGILDFFDLPPTGIFLGGDTTGNYVIENEFEDVANPIEDLGVGNIVEDNEFEEDDDDSDSD